MVNALSIDVEDYFQVSNFDSIIERKDWHKYEPRVVENTRRILAILDENKVKATFFVLGWTAEKFPKLVQEIDLAGHEIASHGYWHKLAYQLTKEELREDVGKSLYILESITGKKVLGYRAASYSVTKDSLWVFDILREFGIKYDSSVFPIYHDRYGIPNADRFIGSCDGNGLIEFPLSSLRFVGKNIPVAGGGYFRLYPYWFTKWAIKRINLEGQPAIVYIHPWEIDPLQPRIKAGLITGLRHYMNLKYIERRFKKLLQEFEFTSIENILKSRNFI